MFELLCPTCEKKSNSIMEAELFLCPYCGYRFSGKYGTERRHEDRVKKESPVSIIWKEQRIEAMSTDFSKRGVGITIPGQFPGAEGDIVEFLWTIVKARVVWINRQSDLCRVGLQKIN